MGVRSQRGDIHGWAAVERLRGEVRGIMTIRAVAGLLIVAAVATFLCVVAGPWTLSIIVIAALLYVAALCYAWVLDRRRQRRKDAELAAGAKAFLRERRGAL